MAASASVQEYLEALYKLTGGDRDRLVTTNELAGRMSVAAPSVSEMLRRLDQLGLVTYTPYRGASLTGRGAEEGSRVVRYHRLWERLLVDVLGMSWDEVHDEACRLEHATSQRLAQKLSLFLDHPTTCPHGYAVPVETARAATEAGAGTGAGVPAEAGAATGTGPGLAAETAVETETEAGAGRPVTAGTALPAAAQPSMPLLDAPEGFRGQVASVAEEAALLKYCASVGLVPGARVEAVRVYPHDELVEVIVREIPFPTGSDGAGSRAACNRRVTVGARVGKLVRVTGA